MEAPLCKFWPARVFLVTETPFRDLPRCEVGLTKLGEHRPTDPFSLFLHEPAPPTFKNAQENRIYVSYPLRSSTEKPKIVEYTTGHQSVDSQLSTIAMVVKPQHVPPFVVKPPGTVSDDGAPSQSVYKDATRVFAFIEDERHLTAQTLLHSVQERYNAWDERRRAHHHHPNLFHHGKKHKEKVQAREKEAQEMEKTQKLLASKKAVIEILEVGSVARSIVLFGRLASLLPPKTHLLFFIRRRTGVVYFAVHNAI